LAGDGALKDFGVEAGVEDEGVGELDGLGHGFGPPGKMVA
jgi:hypothetical protein